MREQELIELIVSIIGERGFDLEKLPERNIPTADLAIRNGEELYFLEVKQRNREEEFQGALANSDPGKIKFLENEVLERGNQYSRIVRDGVSQLRSTAGENDFRLLWLHGSDEDSETDAELFISSLVGIAYLITVQEEESEDFHCYFYELNDFYRDRCDLDGAFIASEDGFTLLINPFSPRYERLKRSSLVNAFQEGFHDPLADVARGEALIIEGDVDRRNEQAVLEYLRNKYGRIFANFKTYRVLAVMRPFHLSGPR